MIRYDKVILLYNAIRYPTMIIQCNMMRHDKRGPEHRLFPFLLDLGRPEAVLNHTCNFYLDSEEGVSVGVWHTLPASQWDEAAGRSPEWYRETLGDGRPVIIYLHGNLGTRWDESGRIGTLEFAAGYHVLSLDYRGFGDSTGEPSEDGLTIDALFLYHWVKKQSRGPVCLWGHSLGSAVDALILEAAFTTIGEVVVNYPLTKVGGYISVCLQPLGVFMKTEENLFFFTAIANVCGKRALTCPLLILHAEDDDIVPYHMGQKISLQAKKESNTDVRVEMISYSATLGFSHNNIYLDPNLSNVVGKFLQNLRQ
uniref:AB hydrolase-1 domain-containing protein n=1 Tax=Cyclopterus lumpus TaxID=8103 RepID=A0A8C3AHH7_CYCLU